MTISKGGFEINQTMNDEDGRALKAKRKANGDQRYAPRCPDCGSEGVFVMEGVGMCGACPGWTYKFKANPRAGQNKIVGDDFVREAEWLYEERKGTHK